MTTSRDRVRAALAHVEPDRIPFDLGGTRVTGIHARAYEQPAPRAGSSRRAMPAWWTSPSSWPTWSPTCSMRSSATSAS